MSKDDKIRWGWLRFMYLYTIIGGVGFGLGIILFTNQMNSIFGFPSQDPFIGGIVGCVFLAFGLLSIFGLRSPLKYVCVLFLQLLYKSIWFIGIALPLLFAGKFPAYAVIITVWFASYIIGDLIAIPFSHIFSKQAASIAD